MSSRMGAFFRVGWTIVHRLEMRRVRVRAPVGPRDLLCRMPARGAYCAYAAGQMYGRSEGWTSASTPVMAAGHVRRMSVQVREIKIKRRKPRRKRARAPETVQVRRKPRFCQPSDRFTAEQRWTSRSFYRSFGMLARHSSSILPHFHELKDFTLLLRQRPPNSSVPAARVMPSFAFSDLFPGASQPGYSNSGLPDGHPTRETSQAANTTLHSGFLDQTVGDSPQRLCLRVITASSEFNEWSHNYFIDPGAGASGPCVHHLA
ncbi:hypothetical protein B0H13DRAFT_1905986 [Mycena leptocephala]|nr:hypothetical protein B0H13DRAFT_1905986 [Mycena leptocephala]